jgi:molybdopterin synthase catalytic subunit
MKVRVLLFASLRERAGCESDELTMRPGATLSDALGVLLSRHPKLGLLNSSVRFAVNREFVDALKPLADGDEIALIPPVSGG